MGKVIEITREAYFGEDPSENKSKEGQGTNKPVDKSKETKDGNTNKPTSIRDPQSSEGYSTPRKMGIAVVGLIVIVGIYQWVSPSTQGRKGKRTQKRRSKV